MERLINKVASGKLMELGGRIGGIVLCIILLLQITAAQNLANASNSTLNTTNPTAKIMPLPSNISDARVQAALSQNCVNTYECREFSPGQHNYGCYYDSKLKSCRCYTGDISLCKNPDIKCAFEFECKKSNTSEGYNYDCTYDKTEKQCKCFTGTFSQCRYEISNKREVVLPGSEIVAPPEPIQTGSNQTIPPSAQNNNLSFATAIGVFASLILVIIIVILYATNRQTYPNLMRKARDAHQKAERAHATGREDDVKEYMKEADSYRKQALKLKRKE